MNTYIYVNGNPINFTDPMGLIAGGVFEGATIEGGLPFVGYGVTTSLAGGMIWDTSNKELKTVGMVTYGGFAGLPGKSLQFTDDKRANTFTQATGSYAGLGVGGWFSNANCANDLSELSNNFNLNTPFVSVTYSSSPNSNIWMVSISGGPSSPTASFSTYATTTATKNYSLWKYSK